jgi:CIC family chloride channel protein
MGAFYGGIAHVPLSALVLVCELAGNYDLLVPLMLSQGIAFVALRKSALYESQALTQRDSPVHRDALLLDVLKAVRVKELMSSERRFASFQPNTSAAEMLRHLGEATWQDVFPVLDRDDKLIGLVSSDLMRVLATEGKDTPWALAADIMQPAVWVKPEDDLRDASQRIVANGLRELPVVDDQQRVVGFLDEREVAKVYLKAAARADETPLPPSNPYAAQKASKPGTR